MEGAGAFVCGEETALMASIEGKRGMPRPKPPFPAQSGLWGKPTVINNVETLATRAAVIRGRARPSSARSGTEKSPGTKTFALTGHVANTGLIEVPFGATLRQIVFDIGGGVIDDRGAPHRRLLQGRADRRAFGRMPDRGTPRPAAWISTRCKAWGPWSARAAWW